MRFVLPGELLAEAAHMDVENAYVEDGKTYSNIFGIYYEEKKKVQQMEGPFMPHKGDEIIGVVTDVRHNNCIIDINSPYRGTLFVRGRGSDLQSGQVVLAKVSFVDEIRNVELEDAKVLNGGEIIEIPASKVPRVLGKAASMLSMIKEMTHCEIIVGVNGRIWINGGDSSLAVYAILKIEREAHISGLTDRIKQFLTDEVAKR